MPTTLRSEQKMQFAKLYVVGPAKAGKTCYLIASCLGALPEQKRGLVTSPEHLHVLSIDIAATQGVGHFLTTLCKRSEQYLDIQIYDMAADVAKQRTVQTDWDHTFYNAALSQIRSIKQTIAKKGGVHAVIVSSLTGLSEILQRGISGPPDLSKKGGGMDESKWQHHARQLVEIRDLLQSDTHHTVWEGHMFKAGSKDNVHDETGVPGKTGRNWGFNVSHVFRLVRESSKYQGSIIDKQFLDTKPSLDFTVGGRGITGVLADKEYDLTEVCGKLGLAVGGFTGLSQDVQPAIVATKQEK